MSIVTMSTLLLLALPNGDDFCRNQLMPMVSSVAGWEIAPDRISYVVDSWHFWTGRWLAMLIETTVLGGIDLTGHYPRALLLLWLGLVVGLYVACRTLLTQPRRDVVADVGCTAALGGLFWYGLPAPEDGFYWFTGGVENILPVGIGAVIVGLLCAASGPMRGLRLAMVTTAALLSLVLPGLHELHGLSLVTVLGLGTWVVAHAERSRVVPWAVCTLLAIVGVLVVVVAPGNAVRGTFQPTPDLARATGLTVAALLRYLPGWVIDAPLLAATLAFMAHPRIRSIDAPWVQKHFGGWRVLLIPAVSIGLVAMSIFGPSYALSRAVPPRTLNGVYLTFLLGWFTTAFVVTRGGRAFDVAPQLTAGLTTAALLVFAGGLTLGGSTRLGLSDLRHSASAWNASMRARFEMLELARATTDTVHVSSPAPTPTLFIPRDILVDASNWRNRCLAGYFGVRAVALIPRRPVEDSH